MIEMLHDYFCIPEVEVLVAVKAWTNESSDKLVVVSEKVLRRDLAWKGKNT